MVVKTGEITTRLMKSLIKTTGIGCPIGKLGFLSTFQTGLARQTIIRIEELALS